jgi:hypothetical protein
MRLLHLLFLILPWAAACDDVTQSPASIDCPSESGPFRLEDSRITGSVAFEPPAEPLGRGDALLVSGTAFHEDGLAIREVRVAGVAATRDDFNFGRWTASVGYEAIVTSAPTSAEGQVTFEAVAIDACGKRYPFGAAVVDVDPSPQIDVDVLSISVEYPAERDFVPATGGASAIVTVSGSGRAAGAVVSVTVDRGELRGLDENGQVVLAAPSGEVESGTATLVYSGDEAGTATLVATVEDKLAVALVRVEGAPELSPRRATLVPGTSLEVDVAGATDIRCTASPSQDLTATHFDAPLSGEPMTIEVDEGGRRVVVVEAAAEPLALETEVVVSCSDDYGQIGSGRYRLGEGEPPVEEPLPEEPPAE